VIKITAVDKRAYRYQEKDKECVGRKVRYWVYKRNPAGDFACGPLGNIPAGNSHNTLRKEKETLVSEKYSCKNRAITGDSTRSAQIYFSVRIIIGDV